LRGGSGKVVAERGCFAVFYRGRIEGGGREVRGRNEEVRGGTERLRDGERKGGRERKGVKSGFNEQNSIVFCIKSGEYIEFFMNFQEWECYRGV